MEKQFGASVNSNFYQQSPTYEMLSTTCSRRGVIIVIGLVLFALTNINFVSAFRRLQVSIDESISTRIQSAHDAGNAKPRLTLQAKRIMPALMSNQASSNTTQHFAEETAEIFEVQVIQAENAVTSLTTTSIMGVGMAGHVNENEIATMLVSDEDGVLALIAVDANGGNVNGIIVPEGVESNVQLTQDGQGGQTWVSTAEAFVPPAWSCGVGDKQTRRHLHEDFYDDDDHHDHSDHEHTHHFSMSDTDKAIADLKHSLHGLDVHIGKRRRMTGASYSYWVDIYVEIDYLLCQRNGESCANGIGPDTVNYINALFVGANTIFETEIDTHLNVLHIALNDIYDSTTNTGQALGIMADTYNKTSSWHYTSPEGIHPDLHHALLSKNLGGGIAYVSTICNHDYGFGLSAGLSGSFQSMDNALVWDMYVFMHEIGHNFGSGHTHDYDPVIDTCGSSW